MKKLIAVLFVACTLNASAQFTNATKSSTFTGAVVTVIDYSNGPFSTDTMLRATFDGQKWKSPAKLYGTNGDGAAITKDVQCDVGESGLLKAYNSLGAVTMDANASNVVKKLGKAVTLMLQKDANKQLDSSP